MAIERTDFSSSSVANLKTWLEANATEYFDSFTVTEDNHLIFTKNGVNMINYIPQSGNSTYVFITFNTSNGQSKTITTGSTASTYISYAIKTNNGILFKFAGKGYDMVVSKTSNNHTGIIVNYLGSSSASCICFDDTSLTLDFVSISRITTLRTALCPAVSGGKSQEYFPNVFYPLFRQNNNEGSFTLNGENYYAGYYGDVVLKD